MTIIRLKGFQVFRDRTGRLRCYHRKSRIPVDCTRLPIGSAEFIAECARISRLGHQSAPSAGSLGGLIGAYKSSSAFAGLASLTRRDYERVFEYLKPIWTTPLVKIGKPVVVRIRDKAAESKGQRFGNYVKAVLSLVFAWGSERGLAPGNAAADIRDLRRPRGKPMRNRPWSDIERHAVLDAAPAHMLPAFGVMMFTGLSPKDTLTLPRRFLNADAIVTNRSKTGEPVFWPVIGPLAAILGSAPAHSADTLCANSEGRPWTLDGFRASWRTLRIKLEVSGQVQPGLTLYGLRHTLAVTLRELGCDERTIADALGQRTTQMARHYAKGADLKPKMQKVAEQLSVEIQQRRNGVVKP